MKLDYNKLDVLFKRVIVYVTITLLLYCVMFLTFTVFVESTTLSKWYALIGGGLLCSLGILLAIRTPKISVDKITVLIIVFIGYILLTFFLSPLVLSNIHLLYLITFVFLYFFFKLILFYNISNIDIIILSVCMVQAGYGLIQYIGIFNTYKVFKMVGSFDNPAGFIACLIAGFPFCLSVMYRGRWRYYFGIIGLTIIIASIILSGSRTGIIAVIVVSSVYFGYRYYSILKKNRKYFILAIVIALIAVIGLLFFKKNSTIGRILILKNSCEMVKNNIILGNGESFFLRSYMQYQADYFKQNPNSLYTILADNVTHPFNEYLLLIIEYGLLGVLLLLLVLVVIIRYSEQFTIHHLCLLSIGISACFSYPMRYPFVTIIIAYSLANIKLKEIFTLQIKAFGKTVITILIGVIFMFLVKDIIFEKCWGQLVQKSNFSNYEELLDDYEKLYLKWNGDPMFLYNYGAVLNRAGNYEKSITILNECAKYFDDYDVQMVMADNYVNLKQWDNAEVYYMNAHNMIPNRFMPLYKLMLLYQTTGDKSELFKMATTIIKKRIKISSGTVSYIKNEAKNILKNTLTD